jgi:hypothetical protein
MLKLQWQLKNNFAMLTFTINSLQLLLKAFIFKYNAFHMLKKNLQTFLLLKSESIQIFISATLRIKYLLK